MPAVAFCEGWEPDEPVEGTGEVLTVAGVMLIGVPVIGVVVPVEFDCCSVAAGVAGTLFTRAVRPGREEEVEKAQIRRGGERYARDKERIDDGLRLRGPCDMAQLRAGVLEVLNEGLPYKYAYLIIVALFWAILKPLAGLEKIINENARMSNEGQAARKSFSKSFAIGDLARL